MEEITRWNIEHTDILKILRERIQEGRLISWSKALDIGIRRVYRGQECAAESPEYDALRDLYQFILEQRKELLGNPAVREAKGTERTDALSACIICGIRALQREGGLPGTMSTMRLKLLQRYVR